MLESRERPWNVSDIARTLAHQRPVHTYYSYQCFLQHNLHDRHHLVRRLEERKRQSSGGDANALRLQARAPPRSPTSSSLESLDELYEEAEHVPDLEESEEEEMDEETSLAFEALQRERTNDMAPVAPPGAGASETAAAPRVVEQTTAVPTASTPSRAREEDALFEEPNMPDAAAPVPAAPAVAPTPPRRTPRVPVSQMHADQLVDALVQELADAGVDASSIDVDAQLDAPLPPGLLERVAEACAEPRPTLAAWQQYVDLHARTLWQTALDRYSLRATPMPTTNPASPDSSERSVDAVLTGEVHTPESQAIPPQYTPHSVRVGQRSGHHEAKVSARAHLERIPPEAPSPTVERQGSVAPAPTRRAALAEERMARALYEARVWELCADYGLVSPRQLVPFLLPVGGDVDRCRRRLDRHMRQLAQRYDLDMSTVLELLEAHHGDLAQLITVLDIQRRGRSRHLSRTPSATT
ncbi:hypothetical protein MNAN1_003959 [Malassezia nana]|uniref:Uncharacterized protein n=1 Tax=Malassezia nana TaxID=180528 RepID=A0AAF0J599_9BASI|nr:hypothetical protein MNAN1_003959 [Malassezia nana]